MGFFVNRPIFAMVISIIMCLVGAISLGQLSREQYPNVAPPQVKVTATYPGASPATIETEVAAPIERGLRAGGRDGCRVHGIDAHGERAADLAAAVRLGLRIDSDAVALAALAHAIAHRDDLGPNPCVLLSS